MHLQRTHYNGMNGQSRILKQISWVIYNHLKIYGKERVNYIQNYHSTQTDSFGKWGWEEYFRILGILTKSHAGFFLINIGSIKAC